jgi:hypothetical protein
LNSDATNNPTHGSSVTNFFTNGTFRGFVGVEFLKLVNIHSFLLIISVIPNGRGAKLARIELNFYL